MENGKRLIGWMGKPVFVADLVRDSRDNAFNLLRLSAAFLVFASHESLVTANAPSAPGYFGVYVFFIISGFLIARSWEQRRSTIQYFRNRGLRIFPALWAVVLISTFVLGPMATKLPLSKYLSDPATWRYLLNLVFDNERILPGVFQSNPNHEINVPLWTLLHEVLFYATLAVLGLLCRERLRYVVLSVYLILLVQNNMSLLHGHGNPVRPDSLIIYFFGGSLFWFYREYILFSRALLLLALLALCAQLLFSLDNLLWCLSLPYVVLWLGLRRPPALFGHFIRNDYSYGLYVWGMVCQQCVLAATGMTNALYHGILALLFAGVCAYLSWNLLEKRALKFKTLPFILRRQRRPGSAYLKVAS